MITRTITRMITRTITHTITRMDMRVGILICPRTGPKMARFDSVIW